MASVNMTLDYHKDLFGGRMLAAWNTMPTLTHLSTSYKSPDMVSTGTAGELCNGWDKCVGVASTCDYFMGNDNHDISRELF